MSFNLDTLVRPNIKSLKPYASARHEFEGEASVFLDANENPFGSPLATAADYNRYPDPLQLSLKAAITQIKGVPTQNIFIGNGSDEAIDLAYRIFCEPGIDNVIICPPTYGMYEVSAAINNVAVKKVLLTQHFQLDVPAILAAADVNTKLLFICSPNNPTANSLDRKAVTELIQKFAGLVIVDEAYINFSTQQSFIRELTEYPNLLVMQTLSKAWGLAALRLGLAFASTDIINVFNKVKPPYNVNQASQELALSALQNLTQVNEWIRVLTEERAMLTRLLGSFEFVKKVYPSEANFLLLKVDDATLLYDYLKHHGVVVRNRSKEPLCDECLRISIGTPAENLELIQLLNNYA